MSSAPSASCARGQGSASDLPSSSSGSATFSSTESGSSRLAPWKIIAIGPGRSAVALAERRPRRRGRSSGRRAPR